MEESNHEAATRGHHQIVVYRQLPLALSLKPGLNTVILALIAGAVTARAPPRPEGGSGGSSIAVPRKAPGDRRQ